jgi:hypothetical protein
MPSPEKWRILYIHPRAASKLERQIVAEFDRIYLAEGKPPRMVLFSHATIRGYAISTSPESVRYCASMFALGSWEESDNPHGFGNATWLAGDETFK